MDKINKRLLRDSVKFTSLLHQKQALEKLKCINETIIEFQSELKREVTPTKNNSGRMTEFYRFIFVFTKIYFRYQLKSI
ncbi:hypothetical protein BpHYR1_023317 [Brachionus plicatilis]|uniref:Uncharacterized protein n=1 Tax=Brachionus plicatilis TaxID=10195 RepID=A0A3M7RPM5_BRAPC|nr:hypothetical protein BpHYR1_023317 [Brachionus plicatilis]